MIYSRLCLFSGNWFSVNGKLVNGKHFPVNRKYFSVKEKFGLISFIFGEKHFLEIVKNLEISYYILIISNLVLKPLIAIYFCFEYFFLILSLKICFLY